jgi:hypothetical protein
MVVLFRLGAGSSSCSGGADHSPGASGGSPAPRSPIGAPCNGSASDVPASAVMSVALDRLRHSRVLFGGVPTVDPGLPGPDDSSQSASPVTGSTGGFHTAGPGAHGVPPPGGGGGGWSGGGGGSRDVAGDGAGEGGGGGGVDRIGTGFSGGWLAGGASAPGGGTGPGSGERPLRRPLVFLAGVSTSAWPRGGLSQAVPWGIGSTAVSQTTFPTPIPERAEGGGGAGVIGVGAGPDGVPGSSP